MVIYEKPNPYIKRVPIINDVSDLFQRFDTDNLYPQRAEEILKRSVTLKGLYGRLTDFIAGRGFTDPVLGATIVNKKGLNGQTLNRVLTESARPFSRYRTVPMHVSYNANLQICALNPIPFYTIRLGLKDKLGNVCKYAYSTNWERDGRKANANREIVWYNKFNPDPAQVQKEVLAAGGILNYKGQILYATPEPDHYPLAEFDVVFDDGQSQSELSLFRIHQIQNAFMSTTAIIYPGEFNSEQEKDDWNQLIAAKSGSRGSASIIGLQDKTGLKKASDIFQSLAPVSLDKQYELTESTIKDNIMQSESFPPILLGVDPSGLFAQSQMEEAYQYVNTITRQRRAELAEIFGQILSHWMDPIVTAPVDILTLQYVQDDSTGTGNGISVNDNMQNMSGKQAINFERILRKYSSGVYNRITATTMLQQGFALSDEEIEKLLDGLDQLKLELGPDATTTPKTPAAFNKQYKNYVSLMTKEML